MLQVRVRPYGFVNRTLNLGLATLAFVALSPLLGLVAVCIKLTSRGPVFYKQQRVGLDRRKSGSRSETDLRVRDLGGRPFCMYKFRTMRVGAERGTGPVWARPGDSRVTRLGRTLRRLRIDEFPQLWNVILGDMNVVGPRPERPKLVAYLNEEIQTYALRHRVRPGITGWAQVNQAYDTTLQSVRSKLLYDLDYMERRTLLFDLGIMLKTIPAIVKKRGGW